MLKHTVQDILQQYQSSAQPHKPLPIHYLKALDKLMTCRTAALGGHAQYCENNHLCGIWYNSCKHRFCPQCRGMATEEWLINTKNILLDCPHHHIIFTLPSSLNDLWRFNQAVMTNILFQAAQKTLLLFSKDPKYLNAIPGILCALHTWGRSQSLHPHIHALISHGGINAKGEWVVPKKGSLFPQEPLMRVFRGKLIAMIRQAMKEENWCFPPDQQAYQINNLLNKLGRKPWVVHCCKRYDYADGVAKYLSRYVKSGPLKNQQIVHADAQQVTYQYQSHQTKRKEKLTLPIETFVRRLIQHTPLQGKPSVRYCGLYNSAARTKLNQAREAHGQMPVSERTMLRWQEFLADKDCLPVCETCGHAITKMVDIPPLRKVR